MSKKSKKSETSEADVLTKDAETRLLNVSAKMEPVNESTEPVKEMITDMITEPVEEKPKPEEPKAEEPNSTGEPKSDEKKSLREILNNLISEGTHTQKEILDAAFKSYPSVLKSTISTILSDSKNSKYCRFPFLVKIVDGKYMFSDQPAPLYKK